MIIYNTATVISICETFSKHRINLLKLLVDLEKSTGSKGMDNLRLTKCLCSDNFHVVLLNIKIYPLWASNTALSLLGLRSQQFYFMIKKYHDLSIYTHTHIYTHKHIYIYMFQFIIKRDGNLRRGYVLGKILCFFFHIFS